MKRLVLLVVSLVALLGLTSSTSLAAVKTISTFSYSSGSAWVLTQRATLGQPITVPAGMTQLNRFTFRMWLPATTTFRGYVYAWDGSKATGPALYESEDRNTSGESELVTFVTGSIPVTPGAKYVIFVSTSKNSGAALSRLALADLAEDDDVGDPYPDSTWVSLDNGTNVSAWTTSNWVVPAYGGDLAFTAYFTDAVGIPCYSLSTSASPTSGGTVSVNFLPNCPTDATKYAQGTQMLLSAIEQEGYRFTNWSGDASGVFYSIYVTMNSDKRVIANFIESELCYTLTKNVLPSEGGTIKADPAPNCTSDPTKYRRGTFVTLTATPNVGYGFNIWIDRAGDPANPITVRMDSDTQVTAHFNALFSLTLIHTGSGSDPVARPPNSYGGSPGQYIPGEAIMLTASPEPGWQVSGWMGTSNDSSTSTTNILIMPAANSNASVAYSPIPCHTLTTASDPISGGSVGASPGPNCATDATKYTQGTLVTLTASSATGYAFSGWSGDATGSSNSTVVTMSKNTFATANFAAIPCYSLTTAPNPSGGGTVGANPAPNCVTAAGKYTQGTVVTLSPAANTGYTFSGWSGDITGTTNPTTVTMSTDKSVTASFTGAPELAITDFTPVQTRPGSRSFNLTWTVTNQGPLTAPGIWKDTVYLSADGTLDLGDTVLKKSVRQRESLAAAGNYSEKMRVNLPRGDSRRYLILRTDDENTVFESDESNNTHVYQITVPVMADAPDEADADLP